MKLNDWIKENWLDVDIIEPDLLFNIKDVGLFLVIKAKDGLLFDDSFSLILDDLESDLADSVDYFAFCFGNQWYYYHKNDDPELIPFKHLGKINYERQNR